MSSRARGPSRFVRCGLWAAGKVGRSAAAACLLAGGGLIACGDSGPEEGSSAERGREVIVQKGCGACHRIGGIERAGGRIGPSLESFRSKRDIADRLPNTPAQVARWIRDPRVVDPKTIMPDLGLSEREAREVVAYLYTQ